MPIIDPPHRPRLPGYWEEKPVTLPHPTVPTEYKRHVTVRPPFVPNPPKITDINKVLTELLLTVVERYAPGKERDEVVEQLEYVIELSPKLKPRK